jgi:hypothetical protein
VSYSQFTTIMRIITQRLPDERNGGEPMDKRRLEQIEKHVISFFQARRQTRILAKELFESTNAFANADIVRALEALEKQARLLVRHTTEGNDYISLTPQGVESLGLRIDAADELPAIPHPPKSATKAV